MEILAERMKLLRQDAKLKQVDAAKALGISISAYCRYEYGQREPEAMARLYHVSADYLLGITDDLTWRGPADEP